MDLISTYWFHSSARTRQKSMAYLEAYEKHLSRFKNKSPVFYEIGCGYPQSLQPEGAMGMGGSLQMFSSWLGIGTKIVGIDILPECTEFADSQSNIFVEIGSQTDTAFLSTILTRHGDPDIILDDGSHNDLDMLDSFQFLFPHLKNGGVYIIEDCGGNHLKGTDRQPPKDYLSQDRFVFKCFQKVLEMNQYYAKNYADKPSNVVQAPFWATNMGFMIKSISFYPNLVIFEKGTNVPMDQMVAPAHYMF